MNTCEILKRIYDTVEENAGEIIAAGRQIRENPELGYREEKTSALVRSVFDRLGIGYTYPHALTGVRAKIGSGRFNICIIGELDALICGGKNAHACGHNAQIAAMLGAAYGLAKSGVLSELDGSITFMATPAEEFIDTDYRRGLRAEGKIDFFGGKQQLIYEGAFDDVDMAMMLHAQPDEPAEKLYMRGYNLGFNAAGITLRGKAAHGSTPYDGVNALNAAALAIIGIHSNRETFRDEDRIRIHPIITKGGDVVNSVPDEVCIDTYVRGASIDAIAKGEQAVRRSVAGAAQIIGASAEIERISGYLPLRESRELSDVMEQTAAGLLGSDALVFGREITGSTDIGDLSHLIPVIQPSVGGFYGKLHSADFKIADEHAAYITPAKILAGTAAALLADGAKAAQNVKKSFSPALTKDEYINYLRGENLCGQKKN